MFIDIWPENAGQIRNTIGGANKRVIQDTIDNKEPIQVDDKTKREDCYNLILDIYPWAVNHGIYLLPNYLPLMQNWLKNSLMNMNLHLNK